MAGAGPDQAVEQGKEVRKLRARGIWSGGCGWGGSWWGISSGGSVLRGGRRKQAAGEKGARSRVVAMHGLQEGRKREERARGQAQSSGRRRRACQGGVAAARGICPTWRSKGRPAWALRAVGGGTDRRLEQVAEGRRAAGRRSGPGEGGGVQQRRRNREKLGFGEDEGDLIVKSRKHRGLTVKYR
jgi:hypothetical protein